MQIYKELLFPVQQPNCQTAVTAVTQDRDSLESGSSSSQVPGSISPDKADDCESEIETLNSHEARVRPVVKCALLDESSRNLQALHRISGKTEFRSLRGPPFCGVPARDSER